MALGNDGLAAAKMDLNVRAVRGTVMSLPVTNPSTESDFYMGLPSGENVVPVGVLGQDVVEPGNTLTLETDPTTVTGTTPPAPFTSNTRAWSLITKAAEVEYIAADTTIQQGDDLVIYDAYGRVTSYRNFAGGTLIHVCGKAKYPSSAANQRIRGSFEPRDRML